MQFLQKICCATIVFFAYCKLGYYSQFGYLKAVFTYFAEMRQLKGSILMVKYWGIPIGTLMCSKDQGYLPIDTAFPSEMQKIREKYPGRIGYFGKFAVIPFLQGQMTGKKLLIEAVTRWSFSTDVSLVVMIVHPKHVSVWSRYGAIVLSATEGTKGLEKAPAVLMLIDLKLSPIVMSYRRKYLHLMHEHNMPEFSREVLAKK